MPPGPIPPGPLPPGPVPPGPIPPIAAPPGPGPAPVLAYDSVHKSSQDAVEKRLKEMGMKEGAKTMVPKTSPSSIGTSLKIQTNVFGLQLEKDTVIHSYVVHASADLSPTKTAVFTKKGNEDFVVLDRHQKSVQIFLTTVNNNAEFFQLSEKNQLIYDGQSLLFTTVDLFPGITDKRQKKRLFEINGADIDNPDLASLQVIKLEIYVGDRHRINFSRENLVERTADSDLNVNDRSLTQFLELVMNQTCIRDTHRFACFEHGKVYIVNPLEEGFCGADSKHVGDGKYLLPGLKKTVHFIEGPFGPGHNNPSLVVDAMKAAFHRSELLCDKIEDIVNPKPPRGPKPPYDINRILTQFERISPIIRGLDVFSKHTGRTKHLKVEAIHHLDAIDAKFDLGDGSTKSVADYFREKYNIQLKYPRLNLVICKERGNKNFYPMELLTVSPNQRVTISQQTSQQSQSTTRECAVPPFDRQRLIMGALRATSLLPAENKRNELLEDLGLLLWSEPLLVSAKMLNGHSITYGNRQQVNTDKGKWRPGNAYYNAGNVPKIWAVYAINSGGRNGVHQQQVVEFVKKFIGEARKQGLMLMEPAESLVIPYNEADARIRYAAKNKCEYILMITDNNISDLHSLYKTLERELQIVVQDMTTRSLVGVIQGKSQTLSNIINKTNVKLGGLNYVINDSTLSEDQLVIGVGQSAPPPNSAMMASGKGFLSPTVIGYASNVYHPQEFVGDFTLAQMSQDTLAPMEEIFRNLLTAWQTSRDKNLKRIVVYRTATSEGSYGSILSLEIPLVRGVIKEMNMDARLIYIMVSKDHTFRFFKDESGSSSGSSGGTGTVTTATTRSGQAQNDPNIPAGILIDTEITHPSFKQFFLNSHKTLQGTAKTPCYTILADDFNAQMEKLEALTYTLCHHHQIVGMTTSLPSPMYIANEYAKRGRALWAFKTSGKPLPTSENDRQLLADITRELGYKESEFAKRRINA